METHTGEKTYHCEVCGSKFFDSSCFKNHMEINTGEKSFSCEVCGSAFSKSYNLNTHW